jgi:hypothetical protein
MENNFEEAFIIKKHEIYFTFRHSVTTVTMQLARMGTMLCRIVAIVPWFPGNDPIG